MREDFLHFIWQNQYFDKSTLRTSEGDDIVIFKQGLSNLDSGPDFSNCRIKIKSIEWVGNVEIHYKSSDWYQHKHQHDKAYDNVVLHVVWKEDKPIRRTDDSIIPTLELKDKIDLTIINKYKDLIKSDREIHCHPFFSGINDIYKTSMVEKVAIERIKDKSKKVLEILNFHKGDWEQTAYTLLASNFGFKLNSEPFKRLSEVVPFALIKKHLHQPFQVEALIYGASGLLNKVFTDTYPLALQKEYVFLAHKFDLKNIQLEENEWKFSKIRPANFPTIRIAQFISIIIQLKSVFTSLLGILNIKELNQLADIKIHDYWMNHFLFEKESKKKFIHLGQESINNIAINTVIPLLVAYALAKDKHEYLERAIKLLESIPYERNTVISKWKKVGLDFSNALQSQGAIGLLNTYCAKKRCLDCALGIQILRSS